MRPEQLKVSNLDNLKNDDIKTSSKVDINILLNRVREEKKKAKKENIVISCAVGSIVIAVGIIASL